MMAHALGKQAAARVTRRRVAELEPPGETFADRLIVSRTN
jgi:hypothetical protein